MTRGPLPDPSSPFRRPVPIHDLPKGGHPFHVEAQADERALIATALDLVALDRLVAFGVLRPQGAVGRVKLEGRLLADVVQTCVVSLDDVSATIDVPFERLYAADAEEEIEDGDRSADVFLDLSSELPGDRQMGGIVDVGAAAVEQLALDLDPYPRKPGALFTGCDGLDAESGDVGGKGADHGDEGTRKGGFTGLSAWRAGGKIGETP